MCGYADRADARTAATVGNRKGFMQVQVTDIRTDITRVGQPYLRIHVGSVHINLSAVVVHDFDDLADPALEHAVRRRIGHHDAREFAGVRLGFRFEVFHIDIAPFVASHRHGTHARHRGRSRVSAVCRGRDQRDVAVSLPPALVVSTDNHKAGILARCTRIGLQRGACKTGDNRQVFRQTSDQLHVTLDLIGRNERMDIRELGKAQRHHRHGRIQLHRARTQ